VCEYWICIYKILLKILVGRVENIHDLKIILP